MAVPEGGGSVELFLTREPLKVVFGKAVRVGDCLHVVVVPSFYRGFGFGFGFGFFFVPHAIFSFLFGFGERLPACQSLKLFVPLEAQLFGLLGLGLGFYLSFFQVSVDLQLPVLRHLARSY